MNNDNGVVSCTVGCILMGVLAGFLAAILLGLLGGWSFLQAVFAGIVVGVVGAFLLNWILCRELPAAGAADDTDTRAKAEAARAEAEARSAAAAASTAAATPAPTPAPSPAPVAAAPSAPAAPAASAAAAASAASAAAAPTAPAGPAVKPSAPLAGEAELAGRKGSWSYEGDDAAKATAAKAPAKKAPAKKAPAKKAAEKPAATEKSDASAGAGKKPEALSAARAGGPDDLKQIKGVGPKMEELLHSMGFFHFDQVASWGPDEVSWVDQNLKGFKGRATRDEWVAQAKILAAGGTTEFSAKVDKGGVY